MGSTEGIRIGEALLDYAERLWSVGITLEAACDSAEVNHECDRGKTGG